MRSTAITVVVAVVLMGFLYGGIHFMGKLLTPTVLHHEAEHAHCYTAGKMFFVSIACVPKAAPPEPSIMDPMALPFYYQMPETDEVYPAIYFIFAEETF